MKSKFMQNLKRRAARSYITASAFATSIMTPIISNAASSDSSGIQSGAIEIATNMVTLFALIGLFFALPAAYRIIIALKDKTGEDMHSSTVQLVIGLALLFFRVFMWPSVSEIVAQAL